jgi:hypothetical protein
LLDHGQLDHGQLKGEKRGPLVYPRAENGEDPNSAIVIREKYEKRGLCVCQGWSFFKVRDDDQCLRNADFTPTSPMRIEIFPPVLRQMVTYRSEMASAFDLNPDNFLVVILNPTSQPFSEMEVPSPELCTATAMAVMERKRAQGRTPDLADALRRVEHLERELEAWREFITKAEMATLECLKWQHFEYCYQADPASERERAMRSLFNAFNNPKSWRTTTPENWAGRLAVSCMK